MKKINIFILVLITVAIGVIIGTTQEFSNYETFATAVSEGCVVTMTLIVLVAGTLVLRYRVLFDTIP